MTFNQHAAARVLCRITTPQTTVTSVGCGFLEIPQCSLIKMFLWPHPKKKEKGIFVTTGELINYAEPKITVPQSINIFNDAASVGGDTATSGGKKKYSASKMFDHHLNTKIVIFFRILTKRCNYVWDIWKLKNEFKIVYRPRKQKLQKLCVWAVTGNCKFGWVEWLNWAVSKNNHQNQACSAGSCCAAQIVASMLWHL